MVDGKKVEVPQGTKVRLEIQEAINGNRAKLDQEVHYLVAEDVLGPNKEVVIKKGAPAIGKVTGGKAGRSFGRGGQLDFNAESATAVDGTQVPLIFQYTKHARNSTGIMKVLTFSLNPFSKGGKAKVKKGYQYDAVIGVPAPTETPTATGTTTGEAAPTAAAPTASEAPDAANATAEPDKQLVEKQ